MKNYRSNRKKSLRIPNKTCNETVTGLRPNASPYDDGDDKEEE